MARRSSIRQLNREMKLGAETIAKLKGTSLDSAKEIDELLILNRGAGPGELTGVVRELVDDAVAGKRVSAITAGADIDYLLRVRDEEERRTLGNIARRSTLYPAGDGEDPHKHVPKDVDGNPVFLVLPPGVKASYDRKMRNCEAGWQATGDPWAVAEAHANDATPPSLAALARRRHLGARQQTPNQAARQARPGGGRPPHALRGRPRCEMRRRVVAGSL
jgi:hypothetical protein